MLRSFATVSMLEVDTLQEETTHKASRRRDSTIVAHRNLVSALAGALSSKKSSLEGVFLQTKGNRKNGAFCALFPP